MKNRFMFYTCVTLMTVLMFSMSLLSLAEQQIEQQKVPEVQSAQDTDPLTLQMKANAERDADQDVNKVLWFGSGMGLACLGVGAAGFAPSGTIGTASLIFIPVGGIGAIYNHKPSPPAKRLIGKSPEYVSVYTDAYVSKARSLRTKWAASGCATGCGVLAGLTVVGCFFAVQGLSDDGLYGTFVF